MHHPLKKAAGVIAALLLAVSPAGAQGIQDQVGLDALLARLGANTPTGANVVVAQNEGLDAGSYGPDQTNPEFTGKTFLPQSGTPGNSGHATLVARYYYGTATSIAPGISNIYLYEAAHWLQSGYLRFGQGPANPPLLTPGQIKIMNNSWGFIVNPGTDNDIMRRADFAVSRDNVVMCHGLPNVGQSFSLMYTTFNGISVGLDNGNHVPGPTGASYDGPGRIKPDLVAPNSQTSFATPIVSGGAALMVETARTVPSLLGNPNAQRSDIIKSVLMCGAQRRTTWTNNPSTSGATRGTTSTPMDAVYGADRLDVNLSHIILTGNEQNGSPTQPTVSNATYRGWDLTTLVLNGNSYYRFTLPALSPKAVFFATWHRKVSPNFLTYTLANVNVQLWRVDGTGQLVSLVGNGGLPYFSGGNVVSNSSVDNVEMLVVENLQPNTYVLHVQRIDSINDSWDVAVSWLIPRPGDVNGDWVTDIKDLLAIVGAWGVCAGCPEDLNGDGVVNITDLLMVIGYWGG